MTEEFKVMPGILSKSEARINNNVVHSHRMKLYSPFAEPLYYIGCYVVIPGIFLHPGRFALHMHYYIWNLQAGNSLEHVTVGLSSRDIVYHPCPVLHDSFFRDFAPEGIN